MQNWIKKIDKKKCILWAAVLAACVILAFGIELLYFNYHPLFDKSERVEFDIVDGEAVGTEEKVFIDNSDPAKMKMIIRLGEPAYYGKLDMNFTAFERQKYKVTWADKDDYGASKDTKVKDIKMAGYKRGVTNIYAKTDYVAIELYGTHRSDITSVTLKNDLQMNRYRMVLIFSFFFLIAFMVLQRGWFKDKLHLVFLVLGFVISLNFWFIEDIMQSGWDENVHFVHSYAVTLGDETPYTRAIERLYDLPEEIAANTYDEHRMMIGYYNRAHKDVYSVGPIVGVSYKHILYLPYIVMIKLFTLMGTSFYEMYFLTKMAGILCYLLIMAYAIKIAKTGKLFLVATGIMPTRLFINSTYNYDSIIVAFLTLGFVLWLNEVLEPEKKLTIKNALAIIICFGLGSIVKQVYIVFVLLMALLPDSKFKSKKQKWTIIGGFVLVGAIVVVVMVGPMLTSFMNGVSVAGDYRVGEANLTGQLAVILQNPIAYFKLLFEEVKGSLGEFLLGRFHYVNFSFHRRPATNFGFVTAVIMMIFFFLRIEEGDDKEILIERKYKLGILVMILITVALIWTSMYIAYTPVGANEIKGVQARYYAPLIYPLMLIFKTEHIALRAKHQNVNWVMLGVVVLLNFYCIYNVCFVPWSV